MERSKTRGRPRHDYPPKQPDDQPGRRLKLIEKHKVSQLKWRNYEIFDQNIDSIDILEILYDQKIMNSLKDSIDNHSKSNTKLSKHNYQTEQDSLQAVNKQIIVQKTAKESFFSQKNLKNTQQNVQKNPRLLIFQVNKDSLNKDNQIKQREEVLQKLQKQVQQNEKIDNECDKVVSAKNSKMFRQKKFSYKNIDYLIADFAMYNKQQTHEERKRLSDKYKMTERCFQKMYCDWKADSYLIKYRKKKKKMDLFVGSKLSKNDQRIKQILKILQDNPYLNQQEISKKLNQSNPLKHITKTMIIRLMKRAGFKKRRLSIQQNKLLLQNVLNERRQFIAAFRELQKLKGSRFFYLGEYLLHKSLYAKSFWTLQEKQEAPIYSKSFISEGFVIIAFLTHDGNLLWQARMGSYQLADYSKLITKMLKKNCRQPHDVIIVNPNPVCYLDAVKATASKIGCTLMVLPQNFDILSPLHLFYQEMKDKMKQCFSDEGQKVLDKLEEVVKSMNQLNFIVKTKQQMNIMQK